MHTPRKITLAALSICLFAAPALAQQNMKPGLWEVTNKMGRDAKAARRDAAGTA